MREKAQQLYKTHEQFVRYSVIGLSGVALDFVIFLILFNVFNMNAIVANIISTSCGITNNFILNRLFNFKKKDFTLLRFLSFFATGLVGLLVSTAIIRVFHDYAGFNANVVKLAAVIIVVLIQYFINKHVSFRELSFEQRSSLQVILQFVRVNWLPITAFVIAAFVFALYMPKDVLGVDESDNFLSAKLILSGHMPYADFFSHHMPTTYFLSTIFYVLGNGDPLGFRAVFTVTLFAWLVANFWLIRKYASQTAASCYVLFIGLAHGLLLQHMMLAETFIFFSATSAICALILLPTEKLRQKSWRWGLSLLLASMPLLAVSYIYVAIILYIYLIARLWRGVSAKQRLLTVLILAVPYVIFGLYVVGTGVAHEFIFSNIKFNALYYAPFFGDMGGSPLTVGYNIAMKTFEQLQNIIAGVFSTHLVAFVYLLGFLSLPAFLWAAGRRAAAAVLASLILFVNARVGLYGPPAIEQTFAGSISQHAELYRGLALVFLSLSTAYIFNPNVQKWLKKYSVHGLAHLSVVLIVVTVGINLIATGNSYYGGIGFRSMLDSYKQLPHENVRIINSITNKNEKVWVGPIDFLDQAYLTADRATKYTFFMPWQDACPSCRKEFYTELQNEKPLIISWSTPSTDPVYKSPGYQEHMKHFLDQHYFKLKTNDQRFDSLYFLQDKKPLIESRLKEAGYEIK